MIMKKFVLIFVFLLGTLGLMAQDYGPPKTVTIATTSSYMPEILPKYSRINVTSVPGYEFITRIDIGKPKQFSYLLAESTRYYKVPLVYNPGKIIVGDTTGVGSTANIGTVVYMTSDYNFYGCAGTASSTVTWKQLNN